MSGQQDLPSFPYCHFVLFFWGEGGPKFFCSVLDDVLGRCL